MANRGDAAPDFVCERQVTGAFGDAIFQLGLRVGHFFLAFLQTLQSVFQVLQV
ncbi:MAG: hypothetical protein IPG51_11640 [Chloroflexi bacterium]|nr:hypothetical protein [Chloroflexota bacterium]